MLEKQIKEKFITAQRNEITEYFIYQKLSRSVKETHNRDILKHISLDELKHHNFWKKHTEMDVKPYKFKIWLYYIISKIFGITFTIKLMEEGEEGAGPTKILYSANLSHDRLTQYLEELVEKELILQMEENSNNKTYRLTEKGREFLREFAKMERFSEAFGIEI